MSSEGAGRRIRLPMKRHYSDTSEEEEEEIVHEPDEEVEYWSRYTIHVFTCVGVKSLHVLSSTSMNMYYTLACQCTS